jgi:CYTH domain-containing protein
MSKEIERKFIIKDYPSIDKHRDSIYYSEVNITQGYFKNGQVRIRLTSRGLYEEDPQAFLTIKSKREGISRYEFEYEITVEDAQQMIDLFCDHIIEKTRYNVKENEKKWEIDVFKGDNDGLVLAEIELESEDEEMTLPYFVGKEVTDDERYYNSYLSKTPYKEWKRLWTSHFNSTEFDYSKAVSICGKPPAYYGGREYKKLAPKYWFFKKYKEDGDKDFYREQYYKEVLDKLDPEEVYKDLGKDAVLLCWENPDEFCHRHMVADWFNDKIIQYQGNGFEVEVNEVGEENEM